MTKNWEFKTNNPLMQVKSIAECTAPREYSAILFTFFKPPFVLKISDLSIFEWSLKTGFTSTVSVAPARKKQAVNFLYTRETL